MATDEQVFQAAVDKLKASVAERNEARAAREVADTNVANARTVQAEAIGTLEQRQAKVDADQTELTAVAARFADNDPES